MELTYECPSRHAVGRVEPLKSSRSASRGDRGQVRDPNQPAVQGNVPAADGWCSTTDPDIQKGPPHVLALGTVTTGFMVRSIFWYLDTPLSAFAVLPAAAALDFVLDDRDPEVTIRRRGLCRRLGPRINPGGRHAPFDPAIGERYRQGRLRIAELRNRREPVGPPHPL